MRSKLHAIAKTFVRELGDEVSAYTFVFPNRRAGLFFRKYLMQYIQKPMFAPSIMSINECFGELSDLQLADSLSLLLRLYCEYRKYKPSEPLEKFIFWGKMMLSDFSEIDNHLIDNVPALFSSIKDWHRIDEQFRHLTDNQRSALSQFWKEYQESDLHHPDSELHERFACTWELLGPLYESLRANLLQDGLCYEGMLHREVLNNWDKIAQERLREHYVFIGFNALTGSERELMLRLQQLDRADFYFDYDSPYLMDEQNKASLFMKENQRLFRSKFTLPVNLNSSFKPALNLISVPSTTGEVHEVHQILQDIFSIENVDATRTAVVLPDEQMLLPLLHAIPEQVSKINVTMGYPLRATMMYQVVAYPEQVLKPMPTDTHDFIEMMRKCLLDMGSFENSEGVYMLCKILDQIDSALTKFVDIPLSVTDVQQLLKMLTMEVTIPYVGEPLDGLQIMGVLETRALDFDNVIITGFNDDLYPGRTRSNSFIPYTLRRGFDLPTSERQDAIFAYNFYRLLSYAKNIWFITNTATDEQNSGEVSRYLYQLQWQYGLDINRVIVTNDAVSAPNTTKDAITKDERIEQIHALSATALTTYLRCPKQFYYKYIEQIREPEQDEDISVSDLTLGNVLHAIMEQLYAPFVQKNVSASDVESILARVNDDEQWRSFESLKYLQGDALAERIIHTYVNNVLTYDYYQTPFQYKASEKKIHAKCNFLDAMPCESLYGTLDRVDLQAGVLRVIDYKTGGVDFIYKSMKEVFGISQKDNNEGNPIRAKAQSQILQTLLYCWILKNNPDYQQILGNAQLQPLLYAVRRMSDHDASTNVSRKDGQALVFDDDLQEEFVSELKSLLEEIYDPAKPFTSSDDKHVCENCSFAQLCNV